MAAALSPVAAAVYAKLQDLAAAGGVQGDVPQTPTFPFVWFELQERDLRGLGTGYLPELDLRTHVFSQVGNLAEARDLDALVVARLKDQALQIDGFQQCGLVVYDDTIQLHDEELNGVKVHEFVSSFRIYAEAP
jgi:hypothetical protein